MKSKELMLIRNFPRIFQRMSASTHDLEVCVTFYTCQHKEYDRLYEFCNVVQAYLDYMNTSSQTKIPQVVIEEVRCLDNQIKIVYTGGDDYVRSLVKEYLTQKTGN